MNNLKNQRGFATLEILLVAAIITILSTVAVPKMARILDKVCLDYELKHLYSDLNFARDLNKSCGYNISFFTNWSNYKRDSVKCRIVFSTNKVTIFNSRQNNGKSDNILHQYNLSDGITFNHIYGTANMKDIEFNKSNTITLNSRFSDKAEIILDSVGRIRGIHK